MESPSRSGRNDVGHGTRPGISISRNGNGLPATRELASRHEVAGVDVSAEQPCPWLGVRVFINTMPTEDLVQLLREAGFSVVSTELESQLEGGRPIDYAWIVAEKTR